jgi:hypothetical protein
MYIAPYGKSRERIVLAPKPEEADIIRRVGRTWRSRILEGDLQGGKDGQIKIASLLTEKTAKPALVYEV